MLLSRILRNVQSHSLLSQLDLHAINKVILSFNQMMHTQNMKINELETRISALEEIKFPNPYNQLNLRDVKLEDDMSRRLALRN
jgi:hypothetical protein